MKLPLHGLRVLEFTHAVLGPACGLTLADLGAEVIKIEKTPDGDDTRRLKGFGQGYYPFFNRNKKSLALDLKSEAGREIVSKLIGTADVLIENFAPNTMNRLGLGYASLATRHPSLIYCSLKGFLPGPYEHRLALDEVVQMMSGLAYMTGPVGQPLRAGASIIDIMGGVYGALGILVALREREQTGHGQLVQGALFETAAFVMGHHMAYAALSGQPVPPMPARVSAWAIYRTFQTLDGELIFVGVTSDKQWQKFCQVFERLDWLNDERLRTNNGRIAQRDWLLPALEALFADLPKAEAIRKCEQAEIPFSPIARPEDLFDDPQLNSNGTLLETTLPDGTHTKLPRLPVLVGEHEWALQADPPCVGAHTQELLAGLGYSPAEIEALLSTGAYADFMPDVLQRYAGNFWVDYAYHIAPIANSHIDEMESLLTQFGIPSFKIFMFYGGYGLHGKSDKQNEFLMIGPEDRYDLAHFEFIMRSAQRLMQAHPELADHISVSLHCELADILNAYTKLVEREGKLTGLRAYSAARPPHSEGLAIWIAAYLAYETECLNINLLHLSSRKAVEAALMMQDVFPHLNFRREVTIGHLLLDVDSPAGPHAKVNPPIRPREDVEYLWEAVLNREIDWIVSDHACCSAEQKTSPADAANIWLAKSGFGGAEYLLSGLLSEGSQRGMSYNHMAELLCWNPAQRFGLLNKGDIAVGYDADVVLVDPSETFVVRAVESESQQGYTPFEGQELTGRVKTTFLRGQKIYDGGNIVGPARGQYLRRPTARI